MNFGYDRSVDGWREDRKDQLATELAVIAYSYTDAHGMKPYVEIDGLYDGVRIRRMTHLTQEEYWELVRRAEEAYTKIMLSASRQS
jgi:hypothetical protein